MKQVEVHSIERVFDRFFKVDEAVVCYETSDGSMSPSTKWLSVERGDAVGVLVFDKSAGQLLFVRQFRYPTLRHGEPWLLELMAGAIDPGETPSEAAIRETQEELGVILSELTPIAGFYGSPGGLSEKVWIFYAETAGDHGAGGGLEGEDIEIVTLSIDEARKMLEAGEIHDGKTLVALYWLFCTHLRNT